IAVAAIPNDDLDWESWNTRGMAIYAATGGSSAGFAIFDRFSRKSAKYDERNTREKWRSYHSSPPNRIGMGSLHHRATEADPGWLSDGDDRVAAEINAANAAASAAMHATAVEREPERAADAETTDIETEQEEARAEQAEPRAEVRAQAERSTGPVD